MPIPTRKVGDVAVTALSDGTFATSLDVVLGMDAAEKERLAGVKAGESVSMSVNAFLLELDGKYALVDAGSGNTLGPTLGKLPDNLRALGVPPDRIETIFLTHLHPDHCNGLVDDAGRPHYPNAEVIVHASEAAFWLDRDEASAPNELIRSAIASSRASTAPYRARMRMVSDGEVAPGISAVLMPGHTPGHCGWLIESRRDSLLIWADLVHLAAVQIPRPDTRLVYDVDPQAACATRERMFDRIAADKLVVAGAHLDFPGFARVVRKGTGYALEADA